MVITKNQARIIRHSCERGNSISSNRRARELARVLQDFISGTGVIFRLNREQLVAAIQTMSLLYHEFLPIERTLYIHMHWEHDI